MRRSPLKRSTGLRRVALKRKAPQKASYKATAADLEAWVTFTEQTSGWCDCGCDRWCLWRENHHVVPKSRIKQEGRFDLLWDVRNRMRLHPFCHERHTNASHRILLSRVPDSAFEFAVDLFGDEFAADWMCRNYAGDDGAPMQGWTP